MSQRLIGLSGNIALPTGFVGAIFRGEMDLDQIFVEVTNATTSAGNQEGQGGIKSCNGSAYAYPIATGASLAPGWGTIPTGNTPQTAAAMAVTASSSPACNYTFSAIISRIRWTWDYKGNQVLAFNFRSSGAIVEAWA